MNLKTNLLALLLLLVGTVALNAQTQTPIEVYTGDCGSQYYRIPAIVTASNGDLLFFNDNRKDNNSDVGRRGSNQNGIDLLVKRLPYNTTSQSYSTTFSSPLNITPSSTKTSGSYCYGDPAVVADRESGEVLVLTIGGAGASSGLWTGNKTSFAIKSTDNGQTWGAPVSLSLPTVTNNNNVAGFFFASGRILQSKVIKKQGKSYYRIYSAILSYERDNANSSYTNRNRVFYSDDFGTTWNLLGSSYAQTSADEAKLEELPNGDLILTTRKGGGRYINKYTYTDTETADGSWGAFEQSYAFTGGCAINADMLTMTAYRTSDNQQVTLLLLSTATGSSRTDIKIFYHEIDDSTTVASLTSGWTPTSFTLPNTSVFGGYSAMTLQADDRIGVYYEGNTALCSAAGNDFSNLYYIAYTLEQLTGNAYTLTDPNPPVVVVPGVEVPDGIVPIYQWQGSHSDRWSDPDNWTVINAVNNTPLARSMVPPTPDDNSNVKIEAPGDGEYNPVLDAPLTINNLYVAPGAAIGNQYWLRVKERVYTDVEIPTNQWVRMSMPLRDTYSGDMYTTTQGGVIPTDDFFAGATYNPTEGNNGPNRVFPYAIYQRVFSDAVNVMTDDQTGTELHQLNSSWSVPYNDLAAKYQVAEGFDLWAPSTEATATFRFPSATDEYAYYYSNGNASTRKETVNHAASGTMAYGNSGNGVMDVTLTRASRANGTDGNGVPMYAVGNPSFSYLDIAEFIRVNAYGASHQEGDASVVGNITPYVYKYDEGENLNDGEASETIYYLDNDKKLHKVTATAAVSNTTMPDNSTLADADGVYVAPTRGFRVMAGQAEVSAVEPKLIGQYVGAVVHQAAVPFYSGTNQSGTAGVNTINYDAGTWTSRSNNTSTGDGNGEFSMALSVGSTPEKVMLENFVGLAVCEGTVDPINQTITIPGGSVVAFYNNSNWSGISALTNAKILGCADKNLTYSYNNVNSHSIGYADNVSEDIDVVVKYSIENNVITLQLQNAFALYAELTTGYASLYSSGNRTAKDGGAISSVGDNRYYNAFDCFDAMTATLDLSTSEDAYICPEMFGTYKYKISDASQATGMPGSPSANAEVQFQVLPIEGNYNVVRIHNLYPLAAGDENGVDVIGNVEKINDNQYRLSIPGAQSVYHGGDIKSNMWVAYGWDGSYRNDLTLVFDKSHSTKYFTLGSGLSNLQISQLSSNPNISLSSPSPGFRGTTVSFSDGGSTITYSPHTAVVTQTRTQSGNGSNKGYTYTNTFTFDGESIDYAPSSTTSNSNGGSTFGTTQVNNLVSWLNNNGYMVGGNYTIGDWDVNFSVINTNPAVRNCTITWEGGTVTSGASTVTGFPQTTPYTGSTSGGSSTSDFTVGSNYEAINLKYTPAMFNANPGYTPSASSAPRKTAAQGSTMASVTLKDGNRTANTLITRRENGHNGYNAFEDASLIDVNDNAKSIATLAGNQMVAVNTLGDTTAVQLVLNNANGNVALTFDNLAALGSNARLFDATTGSETPLDANHEELTVNMTVNDSPLRYSIIWDVVSGTEEVELPMTDGDLWFKAFSSAKGTIKVTSSENMASVRLYDSTGKLVGSKVNAQNETMFEYLLSGIYVVEVSNGAETQSMKVNVK